MDVRAAKRAGASTGRKVGRPRREFSHPQIVEMLALLGSGLGRVLVCQKMEVSYKTFRRFMTENEDFRRSVREVELARDEGCEAAIYRMATRPYDTPVGLRAAISYLGRRDKLEEARRARREKARRAAEKAAE